MKKNFLLRNFSLRNRIFISLIFLTLISSVLIAAVSVYQFRKEARTFHQDRLERKENAVNEHINFILATTTYPLTTRNLPLIFKDKIHELATIHSIEINIHDLEGRLLISSKGNFSIDSIPPPISPMILKILQSSQSKRFVDLKVINDERYRTAYSYLKDNKFKPLGVLQLPYPEETEFYENEIQNFLVRFSQVYLFMLIMSITIAYFLSSYITSKLQTISTKITATQLNKKNEKILVTSSSKEINDLIIAYNHMVDQLDDSASKLAQSEREQAWREMAKQVAHEIKNPLTPMRLTVQSFQRRFDVNDPNIKQKVDDYSKTLIQQIDTMNSVASAFSNFASMPAQKNENLNIVKIVQLALDIFNENYIRFESEEKSIITKMDRTHLIRIVTNLVKNAIQAIPEDQTNPEIIVSIKKVDDNVVLEVKDNGIGISIENKNRIFEPKFTTKSSGMGLGLGIIKNIVENHNGTISFESDPENGTCFRVTLPIINT